MPRSALLATALLGFAGRVLAAGSDDELVEAMRPFGVAVVAGTGPAGCKVLWRWRMPPFVNMAVRAVLTTPMHCSACSFVAKVKGRRWWWLNRPAV